jgi:hypothetical protein
MLHVVHNGLARSTDMVLAAKELILTGAVKVIDSAQ